MGVVELTWGGQYGALFGKLSIMRCPAELSPCPSHILGATQEAATGDKQPTATQSYDTRWDIVLLPPPWCWAGAAWRPRLR
jgi:hypothetical protein